MTIRKTQPWGVGLLAAAALTLAPASAHATPLTPGAAVIPALATSVGFDTSDLVTSVVGAFTGPFDPTFTGIITAAVYRQSSGALDFYYQVQNTSSAAHFISRVTNSSFAGFLTDVYYRVDGNSFTANPGFTGTALDANSVNFPTSADRGPNPGSVVGFNYEPADNPIGPGESSVTMVIRTDALYYGSGLTSVINGDTAGLLTFAPSAVPEPGSLMLLGTGLLGLARAIRRRRTTEAAV